MTGLACVATTANNFVLQPSELRCRMFSTFSVLIDAPNKKEKCLSVFLSKPRNVRLGFEKHARDTNCTFFVSDKPSLSKHKRHARDNYSSLYVESLSSRSLSKWSTIQVLSSTVYSRAYPQIFDKPGHLCQYNCNGEGFNFRKVYTKNG